LLVCSLLLLTNGTLSTLRKSPAHINMLDSFRNNQALLELTRQFHKLF